MSERTHEPVWPDTQPVHEQLRQILERNAHIQENWQACTCRYCKRHRDVIDPQRLRYKEPENQQ